MSIDLRPVIDPEEHTVSADLAAMFPLRSVVEVASKIGAEARGKRIPLSLNPFNKVPCIYDSSKSPVMNDAAHGWNSGWIAEDVMRRNNM